MPADSPASPPASLAGKRVLVMGLGRFGGGVGVARWLFEQGARVSVTDSAPTGQLADSVQALAGIPITFKLGGHDPADFLAADLIVINPAVDKRQSPELQAAFAKGIPWSTEMNLFLERCRGKTVGITGSVGKSTTTALAYEALRAGIGSWPGRKDEKTPPEETPAASEQQDPAASPSGRGPLATEHSRVFLGGNIGKSLLSDLPFIRESDWVVLELSSFMLEESPRIGWSPHIAVITNIFPNHLDRHDTMALYTAAKQNILRFQKPADIAVLNADHDLVSRWVHLARGKTVKYSIRGPAQHRLKLTIPGEHNQSNAAAALAVLDLVAGETPLDRHAGVRAIEEFPGLAHRLQFVHAAAMDPPAPGQPPRILRFFNDSKATTPDASITAIHAFPPRSAIFIVGGYDKHLDLSEFENLLGRRAGGVIGIGQTGDAIIARIRQACAGALDAPLLDYAGTLDKAMARAQSWSTSNPRIESIVLSPASASWDQFPNYEKRGEWFAMLAKQPPNNIDSAG